MWVGGCLWGWGGGGRWHRGRGRAIIDQKRASAARRAGRGGGAGDTRAASRAERKAGRGDEWSSRFGAPAPFERTRHDARGEAPSEGAPLPLSRPTGGLRERQRPAPPCRRRRTCFQNSVPIWLPHWPTCSVMISRGMAARPRAARARAPRRAWPGRGRARPGGWGGGGGGGGRRRGCATRRRARAVARARARSRAPAKPADCISVRASEHLYPRATSSYVTTHLFARARAAPRARGVSRGAFPPRARETRTAGALRKSGRAVQTSAGSSIKTQSAVAGAARGASRIGIATSRSVFTARSQGGGGVGGGGRRAARHGLGPVTRGGRAAAASAS